MVSWEMRPLQHRLIIDGATHNFGKTDSFGKGVATDDLVPSDDDRPLRAEEPLGQPANAFFRWPHARIDSRRLSQIDHAEGVEDVSRQGDKDGPGRGSRGDFRGAVHDAGQIFQPCHLGRPFHDGCRDRHQGAYSRGSVSPCPCSCCPAVMISGVPELNAVNREPIALPSPGATWTLHTTSSPEARA